MSNSNNTNEEGMAKIRKIMTKEKLYKRLDNSIRASEIIIAKEQGRVGALKFIEGILDEYQFEESEE